MSDVADYGMFSNEGNERVDAVVEEITAELAGGADFGAVFDRVLERLDGLATDPAFAEAYDTAVRDCVYEELRLRRARR